MAIESIPITGAEIIDDDTSPRAALTRFYRGFNDRNLAAVADNWAQEAEIVMDNPLGGIKRGWEEVRAVYARLFGGPARVYVEFYDYTLVVADSMFCVTGRERGTLNVADRCLELAIRTSRVYQRIDGQWRQVHHHGSIDAPELLAAYQAAVLGVRHGVSAT